MEGVSTLRRYYCQLLFLKNRFKVGSDWPFQFSWRDIYSGTDYSVSDVSHELAAVMYNIGALHSRLGVGEDRQDSDGMKMAVAHFQCSAWAFHTLPDQFPQVMAFKSQLCLPSPGPGVHPGEELAGLQEAWHSDQGVRAGGGVLQAGPQAAGDEWGQGDE